VNNLDVALLVLRLAIGLTLAAHGAQKLFGWFGGYGLKGTSGWLASLGLKPAAPLAVAAGASEFLGGIFLALGLLTPLAGVAVAATMLMASLLLHWPRFWNTGNGIELPFALGSAAVALAISGAGAFSLDGLLGISLPTTLTLALAAIAVLSVLFVAGSRAGQAAQAAAQAADD
jgi:putative oxidoreductase